MRKLLILVCSTFLCHLAAAQKADPCADTESTPETAACLQKVFKSKDKELNEAYQALMKELRPSQSGDGTDYAAVRKELAEAQRAWIKFRDGDCQALYKNFEQGSIRGIVFVNCLIDHTERRTAQLRKWGHLE